jgi:hypothetical protein
MNKNTNLYLLQLSLLITLILFLIWGTFNGICCRLFAGGKRLMKDVNWIINCLIFSSK